MRARPTSAPAVDKPQQHGLSPTGDVDGRGRSDTHPMQRRGAKSFVDDLGLESGCRT